MKCNEGLNGNLNLTYVCVLGNHYHHCFTKTSVLVQDTDSHAF